MKEKEKKLKIYNFSNPLMNTELLSVLGDKFSRTLSFEIEYVREPETADVILWDGIMGPRAAHLERLLKCLKEGKALFLLGESQTLFKGHPVVKEFELDAANVVEAAGWSLLPEEIIARFEACYQKLNHV